MRIDQCPHCKGDLEIRKKVCCSCGLQLEADFDENPLFSLNREEQELVLEFILVGGNFKALGDKLGLTYPTLRLRMDKIIAKLETKTNSFTAAQILDMIHRGEITPLEGIERLKSLKNKGKSVS